MKKHILSWCIALLLGFFLKAQSTSSILQKGQVVTNLAVSENGNEKYALYLPTEFEQSKNWPVIFVLDSGKDQETSLSILRDAAEKYGYILVAPSALNDALTITDNSWVVSNTIKAIQSNLPFKTNTIYLASFGNHTELATTLAVLRNDINGVLSFESPIPDMGSAVLKKSIDFIMLGANDNMEYLKMLESRRSLGNQKINNELLIYDKDDETDKLEKIALAFQVFALSAMGKGLTAKDTSFVNTSYSNNIAKIDALLKGKDYLEANSHIIAIYNSYSNLTDIQHLKNRLSSIKTNATFQKDLGRVVSVSSYENSKRESYFYALNDDIDFHDFKNLGWWTYQIQLLNTIRVDDDEHSILAKKRLKNYLGFLVNAFIEELNEDKVKNKDGLLFLTMLETIVHPENFEGYKSVISLSAKENDYETALFYLEELLKAGYTDKESIYNMAHTALLRITPEFNALVQQYLKEARYPIDEQ